MGCFHSSDPQRAQNTFYNKSLARDAAKQRLVKRILLLGPGNSGKSTFFKQLLKIHGTGLNDPKYFAIADVIRAIYDCIVGQMKNVITQCEEFEYELDATTQQSAEFMKQLPRDVSLNGVIAKHIKLLWDNELIRDAFEHRTNLSIVDSCPHFFESIDRIAKSDYMPSEDDMLLVRSPTTGIVKAQFVINGHEFMVFDVGGQRSERNKWIHCFETVTAVLFVVGLSCYDQALYECDYINAMHEALNLFDEITNSRWFRWTSLLLFLNKADLFAAKIEKKELKVCFPEYTGNNNFEEGVEYIRDQFLAKNETPSRHIYSHVTTATDLDNVARVFNDVQHIVVSNSMQKGGLL